MKKKFILWVIAISSFILFVLTVALVPFIPVFAHFIEQASVEAGLFDALTLADIGNIYYVSLYVADFMLSAFFSGTFLVTYNALTR